jgi:UDP-N-acetylmuramyl tripeptide synthase
MADETGLRFTIRTPSGAMGVTLPIEGTYNVYNALAAAAAGVALGWEDAAVKQGLGAATPGFGRQERFHIDGRDLRVTLAKNPAGLNEVLRTLPAGELDLVLFLNDDIADGRDISWIWDADFELLAGRVRSVTASGRRAGDLAMRLKYAGLTPADVTNDSTVALREAISKTPEGGTLHVIPTYTAMLEVRNILGKWAGRGMFWEGDGR